MPFPDTEHPGRIVPRSERTEFARLIRDGVSRCPVCSERLGPRQGPGRGVHIAYHCTPVECECPDGPTRPNGECLRCRRPRLVGAIR